MIRWRVMLWLLASLPCASALAHKPSDSYLRIAGEGETVSVQWDIALKDLELLVGLDGDRNGEITWRELRERRQQIADCAFSHLELEADNSPSQLQLADLLVSQHSDGAYAVLVCRTNVRGDFQRLLIKYRLLFDIDPTHRGLVVYRHGNGAVTHVLSPDQPQVEITSAKVSVWHSFVEYLREGMWHIAKGFDHILFLLSLLLPSVLVGRGKSIDKVDSLRPVLWDVLKIVSMFTLAHSVTLWLAVMKYVTPPSWLIESAIAFSIVVSALNNLDFRQRLAGSRMAFCFGLVHGFGFANVLLDLGLTQMTLAVSLLGFNLGVELGQILIVLVFTPLAFVLRGTQFYRRVVFFGGSVLIAIIAGMWTLERLFNFSVLGF